jgi:hypothetical protein
MEWSALTSSRLSFGGHKLRRARHSVVSQFDRHSIEDKQHPLSVIVLDLPSSSSEGSAVSVFRRGDSVRKVTAIYYGESGKATECYYVLNNRPRLLVRTESRYTKPLSGKVRSETVERMAQSGHDISLAGCAWEYRAFSRST